jgi:hypothetical protein
MCTSLGILIKYKLLGKRRLGKKTVARTISSPKKLQGYMGENGKIHDERRFMYISVSLHDIQGLHKKQCNFFSFTIYFIKTSNMSHCYLIFGGGGGGVISKVKAWL